MNRFANPNFVLLRTPTLPVDVAREWSGGLEASKCLREGGDLADALDRDSRLLRSRLREIVGRREVRAAIRVASPGLDDRLRGWLEGDDSEAALATEPAVVRYVMRMCHRPTPFGLFAGWSVGAVGATTRFAVPPIESHRRHTRLNVDCLFVVADEIAKKAHLLPFLSYVANTTVYEVGGRLRFYAVRLKDNKRSYHVRDVPSSREARAALAVAGSTGATTEEIARTLAREGDVVIEDARVFVQRLVDLQLLRCSLYPAATGPDPLAELIERLKSLPPEADAALLIRNLEALAADVADLDIDAFDASVERRESISERLRGLAPGIELSAPLRTDLHKPATDVVVGKNLVRDVHAGVSLLAGMANPAHPLLERFVEAFLERFQGREVPLLEALDPESGVGFEAVSHAGVDAPALLEGLRPEAKPTSQIAWGPRDELLFVKLADAVRLGRVEIQLSDADVAALSRTPAPELPPGLSAMVVLGGSRDQVDAGKCDIFFQGVGGTTSGALTGRFLHEDGVLLRETLASLRVEEEADPGAIHAEISHLPPALTSNCICRPLLRSHEIDVGGGSGAASERKIPVSDLLVSVREGRIQLRSRTHGKRVVPHLTCAHAYSRGGLPVYRFLASLQEQGTAVSLAWSWGAVLERAPFLPRVRRGRFVLSLARWRVPAERLNSIRSQQGPDRFRAVQTLRADLALPRHVRLLDGDNALPVDLDNVLSIESLLSTLPSGTVCLGEVFPDDGALCAEGAAGTFQHELVVPLLATTPTRRSRPRLELVKSLEATPDRAHLPGGEWFFAKLYCGSSTCDRVLLERVAPLIEELRHANAIDRWFFVRYGDPAWHLRLRLQGDPASLWTKAAPLLFARLGSAPQLVHRLTIDTYDPEVERYGGTAALDLAEEVFEADSDAALAIVRHFRADQEARWRLVLLGMDATLDDLGLTIAQKRDIALAARDGQAAHCGAGQDFKRAVGQKYRTLRHELESLFGGRFNRPAPVAEALRQRSAAIRRVAPHLRELEAAGALTTPREDIAASYLHMWANRVFRGSANPQEFVLYDFLYRTYNGAIARAGAPRALEGTG